MSALSTASRTRQKVLGYPVDLVDECLAIEIIDESWRLGKGVHVVTLNAEMVMAAQNDQALDRIVRHAHLIIPDGSGVVWALRLQGHHVHRLPGIELSEKALAHAAGSGRRVALLGGKREIIAKLQQVLPEKYPGLNIVYSHDGYFNSDEEDVLVEEMADVSPDLLLVALGVPKQEYFIDKWQARLGNSVLVGVGGSFDVWAGAVKRAPSGFRKMHLEWLYRLMKEPWRFKRMSSALPAFALRVVNDVAQTRWNVPAQPKEKSTPSCQVKTHEKRKQGSKDK
jgi:N-acetylglucosaminyldiphosphoundecaprenol N-acetyl-beta-D-mannosaminyltransferase